MANPADFWICDAHQDISLNHHRYGRDVTQELEAIRAADGGENPKCGTATVSLPTMRNHGVGMVFVSLFAIPRPLTQAIGECECHTPEQAHAIALRDLDYYRRLEADGHVRIISDTGALDSHVAEWDAGARDRRLGFVIVMEGAEPILGPGEVPLWRDRGVRIIGPAWYGQNRYAYGTGSPGGLSDLGRRLLREMDACDMILDVSHMAEASFFDAVDLYEGVVIASHSNARALVPGDRQLSDPMIRRLIARDAVIGTVIAGPMLLAGWKRGDDRSRLTTGTVADHIDHVCQIAGNAMHAALGTDMDGGFGREDCPVELDSIADLPRLFDVLSARGYSDDDIRAIAHGNWLRMLREAL